MNKILEKISQLGIVPVIKIDDVETAVPLAKALCEGGLPVAEITFRTAAAEEAIKRTTQAFPDMLVGAGTVLTIEQVKKAVNAGAKFIVSPGLNPTVVEYCVNNNIPITPGCANASDIEVALSFGLEVVKFFPAEAAGGLKMLKALSAPYNTLKFMPTGGINEKNILDYLAFDKILAVGGSFMVSETLIKNGEFDKIRELTENAVKLMLGFELKHVGINTSGDDEADKVKKSFSNLLSMDVEKGFVGGIIEVMNKQYLGKNGHIAISSNCPDRAYHYLMSKGYTFNQDTVSRDENGKVKVAYLNDEIGGFAVHIVGKKK